MKGKIFIALFYICFGIKFNFVGTISLSEIFLIVTSIYYIPRLNIKKFPILKLLGWLYAGLLLSQIFSEFVIGNSLENCIKGFSITIVSFLHFNFLIFLFTKDKSLIGFAILGKVLNMLIFGADFEDYIGYEDAVYVKFYLAPLFINIILFFSFVFNNIFHKLLPIVFIAQGALFLNFGARNIGVIVIIVGCLSFMIDWFELVSIKKILITFLIIIPVFYMFYFIYVESVLNEVWGSKGNKEQILRAANPYNPISLLRSGRSEVFIGWEAFEDSPLWGHGAWATDNSLKYNLSIRLLHDNYTLPQPEEEYLVPSHSIVIGYAVANGLLALIFSFAILFISFYFGLRAIDSNDIFFYFLIYYLVSFLWNSFFSPLSHFRLEIPLNMAVFVTLFYLKESKNSNKRLIKYKTDVLQ